MNGKSANGVLKANRHYAPGGFRMLVAAFCGLLSLLSSADAFGGAFETQVRPLLDDYCAKCHNATRAKGGVSFAGFTNLVTVFREPAVWEKVVEKVAAGEMPPEGKKQPSSTERTNLVHWARQRLADLDEGRFPPDPGRVTIHRLSRTEYNCTLRDLLGITNNLADSFPTEGGGGAGFDNNADTLFVPPILMERYISAAVTALQDAPRDKIFFVHKNWFSPEHATARKILSDFARRGFRRPVEQNEVDHLVQLYDHARESHEDFETAIRTALTAILISPSFLFRAESDQATDRPWHITDYELASRISYFLWSSMPDETLFGLAARQRLREPGVLAEQVRRMVRDPKARRFTESFASQWLRIRELKNAAQPDAHRFPNYTPALREAMYGEAIQFVDSVLRGDESLLNLVSANYTYLNHDLAALYEIDGVEGNELRRVKLTDPKRGGVLGMGAILTLTSYPQRTSPVLRGKWILEEILGTPPPPPPPLVKSLPQDDSPVDGLTLRQQLEKHRSQPECSGCHSRMDPLGFGLENFDPVGQWRTRTADQTVDASGVMPDGQKFEGPAGLKSVLLSRKEQFVRNVTQKMLAYALGRGTEYYDRPTIERIGKVLAENDYRSSVLILEIIKSFPFQFRRNQPIEPADN